VRCINKHRRESPGCSDRPVVIRRTCLLRSVETNERNTYRNSVAQRSGKGMIKCSGRRDTHTRARVINRIERRYNNIIYGDNQRNRA